MRKCRNVNGPKIKLLAGNIVITRSVVLGKSRTPSQTLIATATLPKSVSRNTCEKLVLKLLQLIKVMTRLKKFALSFTFLSPYKSVLVSLAGGTLATLVFRVIFAPIPQPKKLAPSPALAPAIPPVQNKPSLGGRI